MHNVVTTTDTIYCTECTLYTLINTQFCGFFTLATQVHRHLIGKLIIMELNEARLNGVAVASAEQYGHLHLTPGR